MKRSSTRVIALGFALIILAGAFLLSLPIATRTGSPNAMAALFTATSATCVTGLAVADTYQNWTLFGQFVILCMIQVGGLGFMTIGVYISVLLKRRIGLQERETLHESVNTLEIAGAVHRAFGRSFAFDTLYPEVWLGKGHIFLDFSLNIGVLQRRL